MQFFAMKFLGTSGRYSEILILLLFEEKVVQIERKHESVLAILSIQIARYLGYRALHELKSENAKQISSKWLDSCPRSRN